MEKLITVFTPTYNRAKTLRQCYDSLLEQTNKNFIWLIIDDGSTDNTENIVEEWIQQNNIEIHYIKKENGGKASTINLSLEKCKTELWLCLDSDDYLVSNCIDVILKNYETVKGKQDICGLLALKTGEDGKIMKGQRRIPKEVNYSTLKHIRYGLKIETEYAIVYKTNIAKEYPYPIIEGKKFMPLSYVYDQIDLKYEYKIIHDDIMICEYISDGMTRNKNSIIKNNPKSYNLFNKQRIETATNFKWKLKAILLYGTGPFLDKELDFFKCVRQSPSKALTFCLYPVSWLVYKIKFR